MRETIDKLIQENFSYHYITEPDKLNPGHTRQDLENFAELVVDVCCAELLFMDERVNGNHNYYKHAAIELKRRFRAKHVSPPEKSLPIVSSSEKYFQNP
jgi:hypothetical protein